MNDQAIQIQVRTDAELANAYLQQLQALASEISLAMESIASNELTTFRESVARQEMLCALLSGLAHKIKARAAGSSDHAVEMKIRETSQTIRRLNLQYAAL